MARVSAPKADDQLVTFTWRNRSRELGTITIPPGYTEQTRASGESVRTTLKYKDGSYIVLRFGGVSTQPLFGEPDHQISEERTLSQLVIREGKVRNTKLFWREQNSYGVLPSTDTGFTNVPRDRFWLFMEALRSFRTPEQRRVPTTVLNPASPETIQIDMALQSQSLSGIITGPSGEPASDVLIERVDKGYRKRFEAIMTDAAGHFSFAGSTAGIHFLKLSKPGFDTILLKVSVDENATSNLEIDLRLSH